MDAMIACPCCGGPAGLDVMLGVNRFVPECERLNCIGFTVSFPTEAEAVAAWNTRPIEDALRAEVAALKGQLSGWKHSAEARVGELKGILGKDV